MNTPVLWRQPDLQFPQPFDTIFFDIDGVLIHTITSFHATDIAVAEYVAGTLHGLDWGQSSGKALLTQEDVEAFKRAGGYNNHWDLCYLLTALATARLREWRDTPLAERSTEEWAELSRAANLQGQGGRVWVDAIIPASARLDYAMLGEIYHEYYWGAAGLKKRFGREPRHLPNESGMVHLEKALFQPDFPERLRAAGVEHFGLITGRTGPEVDSAVEFLETYSGRRWWEVIVSADICAKPNPEALRIAIRAVEARGGLFIGDTADDHDFVHYYRASKRADEPDFLGAVLVGKHEVETYKQRGADLIVGAVEDLLWCLPGRMP